MATRNCTMFFAWQLSENGCYHACSLRRLLRLFRGAERIRCPLLLIFYATPCRISIAVSCLPCGKMRPWNSRIWLALDCLSVGWDCASVFVIISSSAIRFRSKVSFGDSCHISYTLLTAWLVACKILDNEILHCAFLVVRTNQLVQI